jgi:penicillin-binding protein 2
MKHYSKYKIRQIGFNDIETHEVFLDKLAKAKEEEWGITEKKLEVPIKERTSYIIFAVFFILAIFLFSKTLFLQAIEGQKFYNISQNNKGRITLVSPERGIIYDRNLKKLVSNSAAYDLVCDKRRFFQSSPETTNEIKNIANVLGIDSQDIFNKIEQSLESDILISENISHEKLLVIEAKIDEFKGCKIDKNTVRDYLLGDAFSHLLGYTGRINKDELETAENYAVDAYIGKTGVEKSYEFYLRGIPGQTEAVKNASGIDRGDKIISEPEPGKNIILNIDSNLQQQLYNFLDKSIQNVKSKKGAAIAMDPNTGAVLALVSYPSYDDNLFSRGISMQDFNEIQNDPTQPLFNRAISAQYPAGSTIKPFLASAALQEKTISPTKQINDMGYIEIVNKYDPNIVYRFSGITPHGWVDMRKALAVSSNIYFYTVGGGYGDQQGLGPTKIKKYLSSFGWGQKTEIDLPGEAKGFIPDPEWKKKTKNEAWWDGDTYNLSIGQSDLQTTPLQLISAYCAIANGGTLYKPQIINRVINSLADSQQPVKSFTPEILNSNFIDFENLQIVREGMRDVVAQSYGTASSLNNLSVKVAAKTGTAQVSEDGHFTTWAVAFAPYDKPQIVIMAVIENVEGLKAPTTLVVRDALNWYFGKK